VRAFQTYLSAIRVKIEVVQIDMLTVRTTIMRCVGDLMASNHDFWGYSDMWNILVDRRCVPMPSICRWTVTLML